MKRVGEYEDRVVLERVGYMVTGTMYVEMENDMEIATGIKPFMVEDLGVDSIVDGLIGNDSKVTGADCIIRKVYSKHYGDTAMANSFKKVVGVMLLRGGDCVESLLNEG